MQTEKSHIGQARAARGGKQVVAKKAEPAADIRSIEIGLVDPSKTNPRKDFGDLTGLAASIEQQGILEPLIVRPKGKRFEIVAGERRYRAAKLANLDKLLSIVRELSDADAIEIQGIENIQRQNLKPLEEAAQYRLLINTKPDKFSAEEIGKRQGKSPQWVWDLMKLLDLVPEAKKLLDEGRISVNHAIPIARLTPEQQKKVIDPDDGGLFRNERHTLQFDDDDESKPDKYEGMQPVSVKELQAYIAEHIRFSPHAAAKAAPLLFENVAQQVDEAAARPGRGKKVIAITHNSYVQDDAKDPNERTFSSVSWRRADGKFDSKKCDASVLGVVVAGRGYGEAFEVCVARDKCKVHFGDVIKAKEKRQKEKDREPAAQSSGSAKPGNAEAEKKRRAAAEQEEKIEKLTEELFQKAAKEKIEKLPAKLPGKVFDYLLQQLKGEICSQSFNKAKGITQDNLAWTLITCIAKDDIDEGFDDDRWAKVLGVDLTKIRAAAKAQIKKEVQTSGAKKKAAK
jgi:ParB/RepB/Spo0J family partition protein